jgi:serine/threonine protein kinase
VLRYHCTCGAEETLREVADLSAGQLPPDLENLRARARQALSSNETVALSDAPTKGTPRPSGAGTVEDLRDPVEVDSKPWRQAPTPHVAVDSKGAAGGGGAVTNVVAEGPQQAILDPDTQLGPYKLQEPLGQGGMGVVYKALDMSLDRHVALKVLSSELSRNRQFIERFHREAKACARLNHPNITVIHARSEEDAEIHWFAMELVEGENLADRVKRDGPLPVERVLDIARQCALGLKTAAAQRIIHRDIKPSNLVFTPECQVKITDFGLAKAKAAMGHTLDLTSTGVVMGTPLYMSPEQGRGTQVDQRSDIYSLGATLFFLLYGCPPFEADTPIAIILKHINDPLVFPSTRQVPPAVRTLLGRLLAKTPDRRTPDYEALIDDLARIDRGEALAEDVPAKVIVLPQKARSTAKRSVFKVGKLSVARTNLKLGRTDKAISLLREALEEGDSGLRSEAALLLLELYESEERWDDVRRVAEIVAGVSQDPSQVAYVTWKLADLEERSAQDAVRRALARYEKLLATAPEALPRPVIEQQIRRLREQLASSERDSGSTKIRLGAVQNPSRG